jgi:hypothetical protein
VETPKKERKGLFGLFGSKKAELERTAKPHPPPSIPIQTPQNEPKDLLQSVELPKKERKGIFVSTKADPEIAFDSDFEILP